MDKKGKVYSKLLLGLSPRESREATRGIDLEDYKEKGYLERRGAVSSWRRWGCLEMCNKSLWVEPGRV